MCKRTKHFCIWVAPMKIVASIGENSDRAIECEIVLDYI